MKKREKRREGGGGRETKREEKKRSREGRVKNEVRLTARSWRCIVVIMQSVHDQRECPLEQKSIAGLQFWIQIEYKLHYCLTVSFLFYEDVEWFYLHSRYTKMNA